MGEYCWEWRREISSGGLKVRNCVSRDKERNGDEGLEWGWKRGIGIPVGTCGPEEVAQLFPRDRDTLILLRLFFFPRLLNFSDLFKFSPIMGSLLICTQSTWPCAGYITEAQITYCPSLLMPLGTGPLFLPIFPLLVKEMKCPRTKVPRLTAQVAVAHSL